MKLHFMAAPHSRKAQEAFKKYVAAYGQTQDPAEADVLVVLSGDGGMLRAGRIAMPLGKKMFGLNYGHVGYLMNPAESSQDLLERLEKAKLVELGALQVRVETAKGQIFDDFAMNEVSLCRTSPAAAHFGVRVDGDVFLRRLEGDGLIVSTAMGSTGYNRAAGGPVLSLSRDTMVLTPNNPCFPTARPAPVVLDPCQIEVFNHAGANRPVSVVADIASVADNPRKVTLWIDPSARFRLLFDANYNRRRRVMQLNSGASTLY